MADDIKFRVGLDDATEKGVDKVRQRFKDLGKTKPEKTSLDRWAEALKGTGFGRALDRYRDLGRRAEAARKAMGAGAGPDPFVHLDATARRGLGGRGRSWRASGATGGGPQQMAAGLDKAAKSMGRFRKAAGSAYSDIGNAATQEGGLAEAAGEASGGLGEAAASTGILDAALAAGAGALGEVTGGLVALAAAGYAADKVGDHVANTAAAIGRAAETAGMSIKDFQDVAGAAGYSGVQFDAAAASATSFGQTLNDAHWGRNVLAQKLLNQLGIRLHYTKHGLIDVKRAMLDVADAMKRQKSPQSQAEIAKIFGLTQMLPALRDGSKQLQQHMDRYARSGAEFSQKQADDAQHVFDAMQDRHAAWLGVQRDFGQMMMPWAQAMDTAETWEFTGIDATMKAVERWPGKIEAAWRPVGGFFKSEWDGVERVFQSGWHKVEPIVVAMNAAVAAWDRLTGMHLGGEPAGGAAGAAKAGAALRSLVTASSKPPSPAAAMAAVKTAGGGDAQKAAALIAHLEGFKSTAYWDRNAYRAGFGSDTITDPRTGQVTRVGAGTTVTREAAEADLRRRVGTEFLPKAQAAVGSPWDSLSADARAAIVSVTYNYGSTPRSVVAAARTGDPRKIAAAIAALQGANGGVNARRRLEEAAVVNGGAIPATAPRRSLAAAAGGGIMAPAALPAAAGETSAAAAIAAAEQPGAAMPNWSVPLDNDAPTAGPPAQGGRAERALARLQGLPAAASDAPSVAAPPAAEVGGELLVTFRNAPAGLIAEARPRPGTDIKLRIERAMDYLR